MCYKYKPKFRLRTESSPVSRLSHQATLRNRSAAHQHRLNRQHQFFGPMFSLAFCQRQQAHVLTTVPTIAAISGKSVELMSTNNARLGLSAKFPSPARKFCKSIPTKAATPRRANPPIQSQSRVRRSGGQPHTNKNMIGTQSDNHMECIETNALVSGSQPQAPQSLWTPGIGICPNCTEPKTSTPTARIVMINLLKIMELLPFNENGDSEMPVGIATHVVNWEFGGVTELESAANLTLVNSLAYTLTKRTCEISRNTRTRRIDRQTA